MFKKVIHVAWLLAGLSSFACSAEVGGDRPGGRSEPTASEDDALSICNTCDAEILPPLGGGTLDLGKARSSWMCWPIRYDRTGSGPSPSFTVDDANGNWEETGFGQAACVRRCCFHTDGGDTRTVTSAITVSKTAAPADAFGSIPSAIAPLGDGSLLFLNGIVHSPAAMGQNELADVVTIPTLSPQGNVFVAADPCGGTHPLNVFQQLACAVKPSRTTSATAYALFCGAPVIGGTTPVQKVTTNLNANHRGQTMPDFSTNACTISGLTNAQAGTTPAVVLSHQNSSWIATLGSNVESADITCYPYNQTP